MGVVFLFCMKRQFLSLSISFGVLSLSLNPLKPLTHLLSLSSFVTKPSQFNLADVVTFCNLALTYTCHFLLQFVIWSKDDTQTFIFCQTITTSLLSSTLPLQASLFTCQLTCWTTHHHQLTCQACQCHQTACQTTHHSQCSCHSTHCYRVTCQTTHNC